MNTEQLEKLRKPFPTESIRKLPKPTKAQTEAVNKDFKCGIRCAECGGWHHPQVIHLDYVGHAALTDRLLTVDPLWNWEFAVTDDRGAPVIDSDGGFWIKLTVCGVTRLGYGDAQGKTGGNAMKERIGDALRNAAMRFGCALDLWHKGDFPKEEFESESLVSDEQIQKYHQIIESGKGMELLAFTKTLTDEQNAALPHPFKQGEITAGKQKIKKMLDEGVAELDETVMNVKQLVATNDVSALEWVENLSSLEKKLVAINLEKHELDKLKEMKENAK